MLKIRFDETLENKSGIFECQTCGTRFFWGGPALHKADCPDKPNGYASCVFLFNKSIVVAAIEAARRSNNEQAQGGLTPLTVAMLRQQAPEHLVGVEI